MAVEALVVCGLGMDWLNGSCLAVQWVMGCMVRYPQLHWLCGWLVYNLVAAYQLIGWLVTWFVANGLID